MIKYDSSTISNVADSGAVRTFSHTVADYGDRVLVVASAARGGVTISSVTFNGDALTKAVDTQLGGDERTEIWYILDPDVGTHDVVVTYSATQTLGVVASSYYNVASVGGTDENTDSAVTSSSTTLTNDGGAGIIDVIGFQSGYYSSPSSSSGFSRIEDDNNANMGIAVGHKLSADENQTSTWTFSSNYITHSSVVLVPEKRLLSTSSIDHFGTDGFGTNIVGRTGYTEIYDWYDLDDIRNSLDGYYLLMSNLDENTPGYDELASSTANSGAGWSPLGDDTATFTGVFDGQGHTIADLFINGNPDYVGLFGWVYRGSISNLGVTNADITTTTTYCSGILVGYLSGTGSFVDNCYSSGVIFGADEVGGLIGDVYLGTVTDSYSTASVDGEMTGGLIGYLSGEISNCYSTGEVTGTEYVGGLVGYCKGTISDSYSTGNVSGGDYVGGFIGVMDATISSCYSTGEVTGTSFGAGGFVGLIYDGTIETSFSSGATSGVSNVGGFFGNHSGGSADTMTNCYSISSVSGSDYVGGFGGYCQGSMINCYSAGSVTGDTNVGGFIGDDDFPLTNSTASYWDTQTSGQATSDGGTGKTTAEMKDIGTFSAWDIEPQATHTTEIWHILDGGAYPRLFYQPYLGYISKSLAYAIKTDIAITKNLVYNIVDEGIITKGLVYEVIVITTEIIQKDVAYTIITDSSIQKELEYQVVTSTQIQKDLDYFIKLETSTQKDLEYSIIISDSVVKDLDYIIIQTNSITKDLDYTVIKEGLVQKGLDYAVETTTGIKIQKALVYTVITNTSITKDLDYEIVTEHVVQKGLDYMVSPSIAITKDLAYTVETSVSITKDLDYGVITSDFLTKGLDYLIVNSTNVTKGLDYTVISSTAIQKGLDYAIDIPPILIQKDLAYRVITSSSIEKDLEYRTIIPASITKGLDYLISSEVSITKDLDYTVITSDSLTLSLEYSVLLGDTITKDLAYTVITDTVITKGLEYRVVQYYTLDLTDDIKTREFFSKRLNDLEVFWKKVLEIQSLFYKFVSNTSLWNVFINAISTWIKEQDSKSTWVKEEDQADTTWGKTTVGRTTMFAYENLLTEDREITDSVIVYILEDHFGTEGFGTDIVGKEHITF